jgi:regulator of sigma E protease
MELAIKIAQFVLILSILVLIHEFGHFIAAKYFKTRVEKFYMFFNPWFSLFKKKIGETEYGIGWLPLGGYVKIAGMIDESMDKEQMMKDPQPWEFRSKPAWQRLIIMLGGVFMNVVLAIFIYITLLSTYGESYIPAQDLTYGIKADSMEMMAGLQDGDVITALDGKEVDEFKKIPITILLDDVNTMDIVRHGKKTTLSLSTDFKKALMDQSGHNFLGPDKILFPFEIAKFTPQGVAKDAGFEVNDKIVGINGKETSYFQNFVAELQKYKNQDIQVDILRQGQSMQIAVHVPEEGKLGIFPKPLNEYIKLKKREYSFIEAIPAGFRMTGEELNNYVKQLKMVFSPKTGAYKKVGSFITIVNVMPGEWDWYVFWKLTAFLSIMLAVLNILPIPALDGGHVLFTLYEIITRRKPSDKFLEYAQIAGMIILFALFAFAMGNDIINNFF